MSEKKQVARAAGVVGAATLLSRVLGFLRDVVIAGFFGAGLSTDAFFVAFRMPNLLRRLFAEGSLSIAFVPVFTDYLKRQGKDEAFNMARSALRLLSLLLVVVAAAGILLSPWLVRLIAPGFSEIPEKYALTVLLSRIMFPYVIFICLVALCMGILNVLGHFAAPALAPVFLNIAMIAAVYFISPHMKIKVVGLAVGVLIGGLLQLSLQLPFLIKNGFYFWQQAKLYHPGLKKIGILMGPAVFGAAVYQVNILVGTLLASLLPEGSVSYLYYADRLVQFPLGIFAISTATAVLPTLSRQAASNDLHALSETFAYGMKLVFFVTIPAMVGLIVLREPLVRLLFQRGAFDQQTTLMTASALFYYSAGLWAFSAVRIVVSTFYALSDTKTPVCMAIISIAANIVLGIILMRPLAHGGLALSTSLASMINLGLLAAALRKRLGAVNWSGIMLSAAKSLLCSIGMGALVHALAILLIPSGSGTGFTLSLGLAGTVLAGLISYSVFSFLTKSPEFKMVLSITRKRVNK